MSIVIAFLAVLSAIIAYFVVKKPMPSTDLPPSEDIPVEVPPPKPPVEPDPDSYTYLWDTPQHNFHNVRVICDQVGLTFTQKNTLCACVYQESRFSNKAVGKNPTSTDWGIVQVNDHYQIGPGKTFPSVAYVLDNPDKAVEWMAKIYKETGALKPWVSFTSGAYKQWLPFTSPMWKLTGG